MNPKIQKTIDEIDKTKAKIIELQNRQKELERNKTELENAEIITAIRGLNGFNAKPEELEAFLTSMRGVSAQSEPSENI
jgi:hypothetical protein